MQKSLFPTRSMFQDELFYIESSLPPRIKTKNLVEKLPPLGKMLLSLPVWALIITHIGQNWGLYTLLTEMPTFLSNVHNFNLTSVSIGSLLHRLLPMPEMPKLIWKIMSWKYKLSFLFKNQKSFVLQLPLNIWIQSTRV